MGKVLWKRIGKQIKRIRDESVLSLTFQNNSFDFILSFDIFEHVPDYHKAFSECSRCLKPGGILLLTVPFNPDETNNLMRCYLEGSEIKHILPPEYHGDPVNNKGCLSFRKFGWQILEDLKEAGFSDSYAINFWSQKYCYLGHNAFIFIAQK